jgi:hypothetical protein
VPAATPMPRGPSVLTLYSAADLLTAPGCPVCRYAGEASDRYLGWFALEAHAEAGTITRLCAALGMCARHTRGLMRQPGAATRLTAVYRYVVVAARDRLTGRATPVAACPACEHDGSSVNRALDTLLEGLADAEVKYRCRELGGLCVPHLQAAAMRGPRRVVTWLAETLAETLRARPHGLEWLAGGVDRDAEVRAELRKAIPARAVPGSHLCTACLAGAHGERHRLAQLPGLAHGDDGQDPTLMLCPGHLADAAVVAGRGAETRALLAWQANCLFASLLRPSASRTGRSASNPVAWLRGARRRPDTLGGCTVCRARDQATAGRLDDVRYGLRAAPPGGDREATLCIRHLLSLRTADPWAWQVTASDAVDQADLLIAELTDAFRKNTWAHRAEARGLEMTAWRRAAAFLDGSVFGGCSPRQT